MDRIQTRTRSAAVLAGFTCLTALLFTASGCATRDAKRDDETIKRPAKLEQGPTEAPRNDYPDLRTPVPPPEPMPEVPLDQLPVEPLDQDA